MAKTPQHRPKPKPQSESKRSKSTEISIFANFFERIDLQAKLIFALACLLYANTIGHGFVLDDGIVLSENEFVKQGFGGIWNILTHDTFAGFLADDSQGAVVSGGRYRPLSLVLFACLHPIFRDVTVAYHLLTILLYALTCVVIYRTLLLLLSPKMGENAPFAAWTAAMLFVTHPIHTEVVANIKCCDEILAMLGGASAMYCALRAWDTGKRNWLVGAGLSFFLACMSKENALTYAAVIPLAIWFFRMPTFGDSQFKPVIVNAFPIFAAATAFLLIRGLVLPWEQALGGQANLEVLNNPFLKYEGGQWVAFSVSERIATVFFTLGKYLQLLFAPYSLTHDYYPRHIDIMNMGSPVVWVSMLLYGSMVFWALRGLSQRDPKAFAILLYLLPLSIVSNLFFQVGTNMSERFAFMPSLGFCLFVAVVLVDSWPKYGKLLGQVLGLLLLLFSIRTIARNGDWKSNERLFLHDVAISENSIKLQMACADILVQRGREETGPQQNASGKEAMTRIEKVLQLHPNNKTAIVLRGAANLLLKQYDAAIADYRTALSQAPDVPKRKEMLAYAQREAGLYYGQQRKDLANSLKYLNESWQTNPSDPETARLIGVAYMVQGNRDAALTWYAKGEEVAPNDAVALWELGVAYGNLGMPEKAQEMQQKATRIDPGIVNRVQK